MSDCETCNGTGGIWKGVKFASINEPCSDCGGGYHYPDVVTPEPPRCDCMENGAQVCSAYEAWCSIAFSDDDYNQLDQAERHAIATEGAAWRVARTFGGILAPAEPF